MRRLAAVACVLHCLVEIGKERVPALALYALEPQAIVAQVEPQQPLPEGVAGLAEPVRLGHVHLVAAERDAVVALAGEAVS